MNEAGAPCGECGSLLTGPYCHNCGQRDRDMDLALRPLIHEALETFFAFDRRLFESLWLLLSSPGKLTNAYLAGKRRRFVPPFKMYLGVSIVAFLLLSFNGDAVFNVGGDEAVVTFDESGELVEVTDQAQIDEAMEIADDAQALEFQNPLDEPPGIIEMLFESELEDGLKDKEGLRRGFMSMLPKAVFVLVPVFAAFLALAHFRRRRPFAHHLVFSLHIHALGFLVVIVGQVFELLSPVWGDRIESLGFLWLMIAFFRAQRTVYGGGWIKTLIKTLPMMVAYAIALGIAVVVGVLTVLILI